MNKLKTLKLEQGETLVKQATYKLAYLQSPTKIGPHGGITTVEAKHGFVDMQPTEHGLQVTVSADESKHVIPWANVKVASLA